MQHRLEGPGAPTPPDATAAPPPLVAPRWARRDAGRRRALLPAVAAAAALAAAFAAPGAEAVSVLKASRAVSRALAPCSCDCCEVEVVRDSAADDAAALSDAGERLECTFAEPGIARTSSFRAQTPSCDTFCLRGDNDEVLAASETSQLDTQRFCFFECAPDDRSASGGEPPAPGDPCRRLRRDEEDSLAAASEEGDGNGVPPMEEADTAVNFLAPRSALRGVAAVDSPSGPAAAYGPPGGGALEEEGAYDYGARVPRPQLSLAFARASPAPAPAPSPADAGNATENGTNASVTPWESINDPMPEEHAKFLQWAEDAKKAAKKAQDEEKEVRQVASKATGAMPMAMQAVADAKAASEEAQKDERKIAQMLRELKKETRKEAKGALEDIIPVMRREARQRAETIFKRRAVELQKKMLKESQQAAQTAGKPWEEAAKRASEFSAGWVQRGNLLSARAAQLSVAAEQLQGSADQWFQAAHVQGSANQANLTGDAVGAQRMLREAQKMIKQAEDLNVQAGQAFDTAVRIDGTLPLYGREAAQAAFHAEAMLNPEAAPPRVIVDAR